MRGVRHIVFEAQVPPSSGEWVMLRGWDYPLVYPENPSPGGTLRVFYGVPDFDGLDDPGWVEPYGATCRTVEKHKQLGRSREWLFAPGQWRSLSFFPVED